MTDSLRVRRARVGGELVDIEIAEGRIRAVHAHTPDAPIEAVTDTIDAGGRLVIPGFVESHIHLDKAYVADRAPGLSASGPSPQKLLAELKRRFTVADIYERARRGVETAVRHGCTAMRAHVEINPYVELRGLEAMQQLKEDVADRVDLELVAFAQEGIFHDDVTRGLLEAGLERGLPVLGGCPYMDADQSAHIDWCFRTAEAYGVRLDFHADTSDDPAQFTSGYIAERTKERGMQGQVLIGHLCSLDVLDPGTRAREIDRLRDAEIHVVSLPATESHVKGRADPSRTWRGITRIRELSEAGVNVAVSTNNIENPFTPYGHPDLLRQALITALVAHLGNLDQLPETLRLVTENPARAIGRDGYGLAPGCAADLVVLDAMSPAQAVIEQAEKLWVLKRGRVVSQSSVTVREGG